MTVQSEVRVPWEQLREFTKEVFVRAGMPVKDAETEAEVLIWANLRGVDSHGVLLIPYYLQEVDSGYMNLKPSLRVVQEKGATLVIEADRAFGPVVTVLAMNLAMKKAKKVGVSWAFIRNTHHQGAMGYYSQIAAKNGMAGLCFACCSPPNMAPHGTRTAGVSNNPITIAVPAKRHRMLLLDMATSVAARAKIGLAVDKGTPIPEGWALDKSGYSTTDPKQAVTLLPIAGFKGSGLALMFECLCSVIIDNPLLEPALLGSSLNKGHLIQNSVVAVIDISQFTDLENYKLHVDNLIDGLKTLPKAEGFNEIFVPGEPEWRTSDDRSRNGIPIPEGTVLKLRSVAERFGITLPSGMS